MDNIDHVDEWEPAPGDSNRDWVILQRPGAFGNGSYLDGQETGGLAEAPRKIAAVAVISAILQRDHDGYVFIDALDGPVKDVADLQTLWADFGARVKGNGCSIRAAMITHITLDHFKEKENANR